MSSFFVTALAYRVHAYRKARDPECNALSPAVKNVCTWHVYTHILKLVGSSIPLSCLSWATVLFGHSKSTKYYFRKAFHVVKRKSRARIAMLSRFPVFPRNVKEKCNDINCESPIFSILYLFFLLSYIEGV